MRARLRTERADRAGRRVVAALTTEAVWMQDVWQLRRVPLRGLEVDRGRSDRELTLKVGPEPNAERLTLAFLCQLRQRPDDALKHYDRIVALAPLLEGDHRS